MWLTMLAWARPRVVPLAGSAIAVFILGAIAFCRPRDVPMPSRDQHTIDSLSITRPMYLAAVETLTVRETTYVAQSRQELRGATIVRVAADSVGTVADSLQRAAEAQPDTAWRDVAIERGVQVADLERSNDSLRVAVRTDSLAIAAADAKAARALTRSTALEQLNVRLAGDVRTAGQCRVLWVVRCPSRTEAGVVGLVLGAAAVYELTRR